MVLVSVSIQTTFAGGSSYSWKSLAHDAVLAPGDYGPGGMLAVTVSNYFADQRSIKVNKIEAMCVGSKIIDGANFYDESTGNVVPFARMRRYKNFQLVGYMPNTIVPANSDATFYVNFKVKDNASAGSFTYCAVNKVKISDPQTGDGSMFVGPGGYGFNDTNEASIIIIGTGSKIGD